MQRELARERDLRAANLMAVDDTVWVIDSGTYSTSPRRSRMAKVGLCPIADSGPRANARAVNRLAWASTT